MTVSELRKSRKIIIDQMDVMSKGPMTKQGRAQFELMDSEQRRQLEQQRALEGDEPKANRQRRYRAFCSYLRHGVRPGNYSRGISEEDRSLLISAREARLQEGVLGGAYPSSGSGFLAPILFSDAVEAAKKFWSDLFVTSTIRPTAIGTALPYPNADDTSVSGEMINENADLSANNGVIASTGQVLLSSYKFSSRVIRISYELLQDGYFDFENWLIEQLAIRIARAASVKFTTGQGPNFTSGSPLAPTPEPTGIVTAASVGVSSATTPALIGDENQTTPDSTQQIGWTDLKNLTMSVDAAYRRRGSFMMHSTTLNFVQGLRDKFGRPLFREGTKDGEFDRLLGYPCFLNEDMDQLGPGKKPVIFGDLSKYLIRNMRRLTVLRLDERYILNGQIGFIAFDRMDGDLLSAGHPVKYIQCHG